jgi:hypothetical protein
VDILLVPAVSVPKEIIIGLVMVLGRFWLTSAKVSKFKTSLEKNVNKDFFLFPKKIILL